MREDRRGQGRWGWEDGKKEQQIKREKNEEGRREGSNRVKKEIDKTEVHCTLYPDAMMNGATLLSATVADVIKCDAAITEASLTFVHWLRRWLVSGFGVLRVSTLTLASLPVPMRRKPLLI